jgi:hypothetical protein
VCPARGVAQRRRGARASGGRVCRWVQVRIFKWRNPHRAIHGSACTTCATLTPVARDVCAVPTAVR